MWRFLLRAGRTAALVVVGVAVYLLGWQERMIYFPREYGDGEVEDFVGRGGVVLPLVTTAGRHRVFFRAGRPGAERLWILCAGNASLVLDLEGEARRWDADAGWLLVDYPGYGGNPGRPSPSSVQEAVTGAVAALADHLGTTPAALAPRLGAAGQSLGAAAALMAAETFSLNRVVLIAPFTTMTEMGRLVVGWPLCLLNRHRYDNRRALAAVRARGGRVWIVHGAEDEAIPVSMARELAAVDPVGVRLLVVPGGRHNDLWDVAPDVLKRVFDEAGAR
jgi:pimeloyl-ACP methyl ester carboxylesterase